MEKKKARGPIRTFRTPYGGFHVSLLNDASNGSAWTTLPKIHRWPAIRHLREQGEMLFVNVADCLKRQRPESTGRGKYAQPCM